MRRKLNCTSRQKYWTLIFAAFSRNFAGFVIFLKGQQGVAPVEHQPGTATHILDRPWSRLISFVLILWFR